MRQWSAAVVTAAALYALPPLVLVTILGPPWALAPLAACVGVLVWAALRLWSPLVVLALVVVAGLSFGIWWFVVVSGDTCGTSHAAEIVEWSGAVVIALALPARQLPRGRGIFWAIPAAAVLAAIWFIAVAHLIPNGSGGCFG